MACTPALACRLFLKELDKINANRNKASDGICGDDAHQNRKSDHNKGNAVDGTHDPLHGIIIWAIAEYLRKRVLSGKERRIKYIICNGKIFNPSVSTGWRTYNGKNGHFHHIHISIHSDQRNNLAAWLPDFGIPEPQPSLEDDMYLDYATDSNNVYVIASGRRELLKGGGAQGWLTTLEEGGVRQIRGKHTDAEIRRIPPQPYVTDEQ